MDYRAGEDWDQAEKAKLFTIASDVNLTILLLFLWLCRLHLTKYLICFKEI